MNIISVITPLIIVALAGYISTKSQWLSKMQLDALTKFTFYISIPAFLFYQMAVANFSDQVSPQLFAAFYLSVLTVYLLTWLINYFFYHKDNTENINQKQHKNSAASAVFALGASYSNTIIVGLPVLLLAIGEQVVGIVFLIVTFHSAMIFTLTSVIATKHSSKTSSADKKAFNWLIIIKQTFNNPLIISILAGLLFNVLSIPIPNLIADSLILMGKPTITLALFILGASLAFYQVRDELKFIGIASIFKLVILPAFVFISSQYIFNLSSIVVTVLVILSACPTGVNAYLMAKAHNQHQETVAGTVVVSTLFSIITIPLWLTFIS